MPHMTYGFLISTVKTPYVLLNILDVLDKYKAIAEYLSKFSSVDDFNYADVHTSRARTAVQKLKILVIYMVW